MNLAFISTVRGYRWAGTEEVWYAAALKALDAGHKVTAYIHQDISIAEQIQNLIFRVEEKVSTAAHDSLFPVVAD